MTARSLPWADVLGFYLQRVTAERSRWQPMLDLAEFLAGSRYAGALHALPTGDGLRLARVPEPGPQDEQLHIAFDADSRQFRFSHSRPGATKPWSTECEAGEWRNVLERLFHRRLQWFHEG